MREDDRARLGARARERVLQSHTSLHRAIELEDYVAEVRTGRRRPADAPGLSIAAGPA
jgi:hypothetical protein